MDQLNFKIFFIGKKSQIFHFIFLEILQLDQSLSSLLVFHPCSSNKNKFLYI